MWSGCARWGSLLLLFLVRLLLLSLLKTRSDGGSAAKQASCTLPVYLSLLSGLTSVFTSCRPVLFSFCLLVLCMHVCGDCDLKLGIL